MGDSKRLQQKLSELSKRGLTTTEAPIPVVRPDARPRASKGSNKPAHVDLYPPLPPHEPFKYNLNLHPGGGYDFPGAAIGKGGSIVREIRQQTGTWIVVCDEQGPLEGRRPPADANVYVRITAHDSSESGMKAVRQAAQKVAELWQPTNARFKPYTLKFGAAIRLEPDWDYLDQSAVSPGAAAPDSGVPTPAVAVPPPPPPPKKSQHRQQKQKKSAWDLPKPEPLGAPSSAPNASGTAGRQTQMRSSVLQVSPTGSGSVGMQNTPLPPSIVSPTTLPVSAEAVSPPLAQPSDTTGSSFWPWDQRLQSQMPGAAGAGGGGHFQIWGGDHQALGPTSSPLDALSPQGLEQQGWGQASYDIQTGAASWAAMPDTLGGWGAPTGVDSSGSLLPANIGQAPQSSLGLSLGLPQQPWQQYQNGSRNGHEPGALTPAAISGPWASSTDTSLSADQRTQDGTNNGSTPQDSSEAEVQGLLSLLTAS